MRRGVTIFQEMALLTRRQLYPKRSQPLEKGDELLLRMGNFYLFHPSLLHLLFLGGFCLLMVGCSPFYWTSPALHSILCGKGIVKLNHSIFC